MIKAKKSLGQNFLIDANIINKIVNIVDIKGKNILEIGPGTGNLSSKILDQYPKKMIVIEKDKSLANLLKDNFGSKIIVINQDILKINENLIEKEKLTVFGNLPYNISSQIIAKIIKFKKCPPNYSALILMFQKEMAQRIIGKFNTSKYGRLSILAIID